MFTPKASRRRRSSHEFRGRCWRPIIDTAVSVPGQPEAGLTWWPSLFRDMLRRQKRLRADYFILNSQALLEIAYNSLLPREPASSDRPLPLRIHQCDLIPPHQRCHNLIHLHIRQVPPNAHPRPAPEGKISRVENPHPLTVRLCTLALAAQPPLRPEDIRVRAPDGLVAAHHIRIDPDGDVGRHDGAVWEGEAGGWHVAL